MRRRAAVTFFTISFFLIFSSRPVLSAAPLLQSQQTQPVIPASSVLQSSKATAAVQSPASSTDFLSVSLLSPAEPTPNPVVEPVTQWNHLALEAIRLANTTPPEATRGLAIMHSAIFDALNSIQGLPGRYVSIPAPPGSSPEAAAVAAEKRDPEI